MQFITQPFGEIRLGEFLLNHLADPRWTAFRAAIAFVKRSGTQYIRQPLRDFSARSDVRISVGVDLYGTSREGLNLSPGLAFRVTHHQVKEPGAAFLKCNSSWATNSQIAFVGVSAIRVSLLAPIAG